MPLHLQQTPSPLRWELGNEFCLKEEFGAVPWRFSPLTPLFPVMLLARGSSSVPCTSHGPTELSVSKQPQHCIFKANFFNKNAFFSLGRGKI